MRKILFLTTLGVAVCSLAVFMAVPIKTAAQSRDNSTASVITANWHGVMSPQLETGQTAYQPVRFVLRPNRGSIGGSSTDPALQTVIGSPLAFSAPTEFTGLGNGFPGFTICCAPPDTNSAVGATQVVETVNLSYEVFTKSTGAALAGPFSLASLFSSSTPCGGASGFSLSDPVVEWDQLASRWLISFVSFNGNFSSDHMCMAVSSTLDATSAFHSYDFDVSTLGGVLASPALNDYDKYGVWPDAYYTSFNEFTGGVSFAGAGACAVDRTNMLAGSAATMQCFLKSSEDSLLPSDLYGATGASGSTSLPPAGAPNHYLGTIDTGVSKIDMMNFHVDFVTPANSTFTGPFPVTGVSAYTLPCSGGGACIKQPSPGEVLDSLGDRLMYPNGYRHSGTHEILTVSHSVTVGTTVGVRWYEIALTGPTTPKVFQQGTFSPDTKYRWMPSVGTDKKMDLGVGYSVSSTTTDPSIFVTGRMLTDASGTLEPEVKAISGTGVQQSTSNRWGDYSSMKVDPSDDCTFWYSQEYIKTTGSFKWSTELSKYKFTGCN